MAKRTRVSLRQIMAAVEDDNMTGFCKACGAEQMGVEPDASGYPCDACGENTVSGAEQLLLELVP